MANQVSRLKELLFDTEARALGDLAQRIEAVARDDLRRHEQLARDVERRAEHERREAAETQKRIDALFERTGTNERLETSVAAVIDGALVKAEVTRHEPLARAIAPLVVRTVRTEIRNSQDELVEALYPMTGRMVKAYVASAMKDLIADINRRLESNALMLRLRALTSGQSVGELALAESQRLEVEELFLIRRGSGQLLDHWPASARPADRDQVVSGILAAINDFTAEAFKGDGSALRKVDLEGSQVYLRASPEYLLAVRCSGTAPRAIENVIDDEFLGTVERQHETLAAYPPGARPSNESSELLSGLAARLAARIEAKRAELLAPPFGIRPLRVVGALAVLALLVGGGWYGWRTFETERVRSVAQRVIETSSEIRGYPVTLDVEPWGRSITVSGLTPSPSAHEDVVSRLRQVVPATQVRDQLADVPEGAPDTRPEIARVEREIVLARAEVERAAVRRTLDRALRRLELVGPDLAKLRAAHPEEVERVSAALAASAGRMAEARDALGSAAPMDEAAAGLTATIDSLARELANAGATIAALLGEDASPRVALRTGPGASLSHAADDLAGETERLAAIVIAVAQADVVNRKPQPAPVIIREAAPPPPPAPQPTPRERLMAWLPAHAVFFGNETQLRQPERAQATLSQLAELMRQTDAVVRVVGYTDEAGGPARNTAVSQQRANRIVEELVARGVPSSRLIAIGRAQHADISAITGPQSPNRRVEFELAFEGEAE